MNQKIKGLLSAVLLVSTSVAFGASKSLSIGEYSRPKAFVPDLNTRVEYDFSRLMGVEKSDDAVGFTVGAVGFWHQIPAGSRSGDQMAKGFSACGDKVNSFHNTTSATANVSTGNLYIENIVVGRAATDTATMTMDKVEHRRLGARAGFHYCLSNFYEGLWVSGDAAVLYERNKFTLSFADVAGTTSTSAEIAKYFKGESPLVDTALGAYGTAASGQNALTALKMESGKAHSDTALNDVHLAAGLKVVDSDNASVNVFACTSIPTGTTNKTAYLFEPDPGVRNFKIGAGACAVVKLVTEEDYAINFVGDATWKYGFTRKKQNIIPQHKDVPFAHYRLVAKEGDTLATPLANVLSSNVKVDVEYKNEFNALAKACFEKGCLGVEVGYNFFYAQEKGLKVEGMSDSKDDAKWYFITNPGTNVWVPSGTTGHVGGTAFANATNADPLHKTAITDADFLDKTPSQVLHKIHAGVNCMFSEWEFPVVFGVTGSYAFAQKRTVNPEYWGVSLKAGVCF